MSRKRQLSHREQQFVEDNLANIISVLNILKRVSLGTSMTGIASDLVQAADELDRLYKRHLNYRPEIDDAPTKQLLAPLERLESALEQAWKDVQNLKAETVEESA